MLSTSCRLPTSSPLPTAVSFCSHCSPVAESYTVPSPKSQNVPEQSVVLVDVVVVVVRVVLGGNTAVHAGSGLPVLQTSLYPMPPATTLCTHPANCVQSRVSSPPFTIVSTT